MNEEIKDFAIKELSDLKDWIVKNVIIPGENLKICYFRDGGAKSGLGRQDAFLETIGNLKTSKTIIEIIDERMKEIEQQCHNN